MVNIASFPHVSPSHDAQSPRRDAWAQETLRIRVRGLGSRLEGEKGAGISDLTPDRHPARLSWPSGAYLELH